MMNKFFNKLEKFILGMKTKTIEVEHYSVFFTTVDGKEHCFNCFRFANPKVIPCSIPEYIMIDVRHDGYLMDNDEIMYPLQNIISIKWVKDKTKTITTEMPANDWAWEVFYD